MSILKAENYTGIDRRSSTSPWDRNRMERRCLRTLLVGGGAAARTLAKDLRRSPDYGLRLIGCLDDDLHLRSFGGIQVLGRLADLTRIVDERGVEAIVIAIPSLHPARLSELVRQATNTGAHVRFLPSFLGALERAARAADMRIQSARSSGIDGERSRQLPAPAMVDNADIVSARCEPGQVEGNEQRTAVLEQEPSGGALGGAGH